MQKPVLNLVVIRSHDMDGLAHFYGLLGLQFEKHRHGSGLEHFACEHGPVVFEIYPVLGEADSTAGVRLGLQVASVDAALTVLLGAGAKIVSPVRSSPRGRRAVVEDPDGRHVELVEPAILPAI